MALLTFAGKSCRPLLERGYPKNFPGGSPFKKNFPEEGPPRFFKNFLQASQIINGRPQI